MTLLEQWGVPLAVLGMLLLTLFLAAVLKRYQAYQASVRVVVRRLDAGLEEISVALAGLAGVPLSRELRLTLRSDILARYQKIRRLFRAYPGIDEKIRMAESALDAEGPPPVGGVGRMEDEQAFRKTIAAIDYLVLVLSRGSTFQPVPRDVRVIFCRELGERRAEVMSRYHLVAARRYQNQGNATRARTHLTTLIQILRHHGSRTDFVRELQSEAESALSALIDRQLDPAAAEVDVA